MTQEIDWKPAVLPQADGLPPDTSNSKPNYEIDDGDQEPIAPPFGERNVTSSVEDRCRSDTVMSNAAHEIGKEGENHCTKVWWGAQSTGYGYECCEHGPDMSSSASKEVVGIEVKEDKNAER